MSRKVALICLLFFTGFCLNAQSTLEDRIPVRGFSIAAPSPGAVDRFEAFIEEELAARDINVLILRVDYNFQYKSHPELQDSEALSEKDVKKLVEVCKDLGIRIVPQINLLGHQSWAEGIGNLLKAYPEFDETPSIQMPEKYEWPNEDGLYCKSYCPLHPGVHKIVFELVDELMDVFEAVDFHAGLDEVFYIGQEECPRCSGHDPAGLFAGEVWQIRNHLAEKGRRLWIWGDRLLDGKATGLGMWEASMNNTHRAIDMIPKDVFICDWHYERPDKTSVYFAMKGFDVATCPWRKPEVARIQVQDMIAFRSGSTPAMKEKFQGIILTSWSSAENFMKNYYDDSGEDGVKEMLSIFEL
ncbi:MAG: family 20 glycosylhydrolase [Bacteroidales bacterium]|nr:family 20 glycosylhydrolase [Bacteroidales bacterium]